MKVEKSKVESLIKAADEATSKILDLMIQQDDRSMIFNALGSIRNDLGVANDELISYLEPSE